MEELDVSKDRRLKMLMIDGAVFMSMFKTGVRFNKNYRIVKGVPKDARLIATLQHPETGSPVLVIHSPEFDLVPDGEKIPVLEVAIQQEN